MSAPACMRCDDCGWVCEAHPERPWEEKRACKCGAPGVPCPDCNSTAEDNPPRLPEGVTVIYDRQKGWRH